MILSFCPSGTTLPLGWAWARLLVGPTFELRLDEVEAAADGFDEVEVVLVVVGLLVVCAGAGVLVEDGGGGV